MNQSAPITFDENEIGTIFTALLDKEAHLKDKIENFDGDSTLLLHIYEDRKGIKKSDLEKQLDKAGFLQSYVEDLKSTQGLISKISDYLDK
ncbi:hypothetical protein EFA69_12805 [Rufibacter immobilis]|uniref:Uncharacterized protein n=1 Tax=Rufibacter immobilis TaxID=1348778 RepID=A0A3M9MTU4_9BACT|nr:hypothetical protein [Rufibacter immobilis]RNI28919.1 hypothetical protein EFA69_12805 [Rufibacter immobilis]